MFAEINDRNWIPLGINCLGKMWQIYILIHNRTLVLFEKDLNMVRLLKISEVSDFQGY